MHKLTIYIPMNEEKSEHYVASVLRGLSEITGGASVFYAQGTWLNQFHVLVHEPIAHVYTIASDPQAPKCKNFLKHIALDLKESLQQEAVLITSEKITEVTLC